MNIDTSKYKTKILEFLRLTNYEVNENQHPPVCKCPFPDHVDNKPSAIVYDDKIWCPVCSKIIDIFSLCGIIFNLNNFHDQVKQVQKILGEISMEEYNQPKTKKEKLPASIVPLDIEKAKKVFNKDDLLQFSKLIGKGDPKKGYGDIVVKAWPYKNKDGFIEVVDVRFEGGPKKKAVITFYFNGRSLKSKDVPVKIYNLDLIDLYKNHTIVICEGAKTAECINEYLLDKGFLGITWNGGTNKINMADWSCIHGRNVIYLPDDDLPGIKAPFEIQDHYAYFNSFRIIKPLVKAREIKKTAADFVEWAQVLSVDEIIKYINDSNNDIVDKSFIDEYKNSNQKEPTKERIEHSDQDVKNAPFIVLGTSDDGQAYFLNRHGRLRNYKLDTLTEGKILDLAPLNWWKSFWLHGSRDITKNDWLEIKDDLIELAGSKDFNDEDLRGRGAWKEKDGRICYHDGKKTIGEWNSSRVYIRKTQLDIGINDNPADQELCTKIKEIAFKLTFETKTDAVRCLGWSILAPFGGCLDSRPQILLTGESGSGKTTIANKIIRPLCEALWLDGSETTPAYLRGKVGFDSRCVAFEEFEGDGNKEQKFRKEELLTLMRISFSDDSPDSGKGTKDGGYRETKSRNMFAFIAIDPTIDNVANENRIFRINIVKATKEQEEDYATNIGPFLDELFSEKNCRAIRSLTWSKMKIIVRFSKKIALIINKISKRDYRYSYAEALMISAYMVVFKGIEDCEIKDLERMLFDLIKLQPHDAKPNETEDLIELIFQERIKVHHEGKMKDFTIKECIDVIRNKRIFTGKDNETSGSIGSIEEHNKLIDEDGRIYETVSSEVVADFGRSIEGYGIKMMREGFVAIAANSKEIRKIIGKGRGYSKIFQRHKKYIESKTVRGDHCVILDLFGDDEIPF